jgi:hypothetical protein
VVQAGIMVLDPWTTVFEPWSGVSKHRRRGVL